jgi:hypothetical protein
MGGGQAVPSTQTGTVPSKTPAPQWCPVGVSKTQRCRLQKMCQKGRDESKRGGRSGKSQENMEGEAVGEGRK